MANVTVTVGSKLPTGLLLEYPGAPEKTVEIKGANSSVIAGAGYGFTEVDADFWDAWVAKNAEFPPFKIGAIFMSKRQADIAVVAAERKDVETGLEPMKTDGKDKRAAGVKKAES